MMELKEKKCSPCKEGELSFTKEQIEAYLLKLNSPWIVVENKKLKKTFSFENFKRGMAFAQEVAILAEKENHHPNICIHFTNVDIEIFTHTINGLSENDFILAAKIDEL